MTTYTDVYAQFVYPNPSICKDMACIFKGLGDFFRPLAGLSFLVMFTYGGFLYMTGRDDEDQLKKARSIMIGALAGIIIILAAPTLIGFVMSMFRSTFIR